jgi:hypothetical protein
MLIGKALSLGSIALRRMYSASATVCKTCRNSAGQTLGRQGEEARGVAAEKPVINMVLVAR